MLRAYNPPRFNTPLIWGAEANEEYMAILEYLVGRNTITLNAIYSRLRRNGITSESNDYREFLQSMIEEEQRLVVEKKYLRHGNFDRNPQFTCHNNSNCTFLKKIKFPYSQRSQYISKIIAFSPRPRGSQTMSPGYICISHRNLPEKVYIPQSDLPIEVSSLFCFCVLEQNSSEVLYSIDEE